MTVKEFFEGRNEAYKLFELLSKYILFLKGVRVDVSKSQISFGTNKKFAWIWLPQKWINSPENSIVLSFSLNRQVQSPKIKEVVEPRLGMWMHHVVINSSKDFDSDIKKWLQEAYQNSLSDIPASIGKPALRALTTANITALDQVAGLSDKKLLALHGVGPKAVRILREYIKENSKDNS